MEFILHELVSVSIYSVLGVFLMLLGSFLVDLVIPCSFPEEIKKGNTAIGWISAGVYIAVGLIIKVAISSPGDVVSEIENSLATGLLSTVFYYALGAIFLMLGYLLLKIINRKYDLNNEVGNGNAAAGIMVFGMFVGLGLVISGVIA
jgi:Predicted membrane protein